MEVRWHCGPSPLESLKRPGPAGFSFGGRLRRSSNPVPGDPQCFNSPISFYLPPGHSLKGRVFPER